jgi:hypothetical protein
MQHSDGFLILMLKFLGNGLLKNRLDVVRSRHLCNQDTQSHNLLQCGDYFIDMYGERFTPKSIAIIFVA